MKKSLFILLVMVIIQPALAQTCRDTIPASTPDGRFSMNDSEVTDTETGLIWQRCSVGQTGSDCSGESAITYTWQQALQLASGSWRLPNINELLSITEEKCFDPAINLTVFPNTVSSSYWSASPYADNSDGAWRVSFYYGHSGYYGKSDGKYVRLVRSGQ